MATKPKAIPEGYHSIIPYLTVKNADKAIDFYKKAFGAKETLRLTGPDNKVGHCELQIGDSKIMLSEEHPEWGSKSPQTIGGTPVSICLYVENVDEVFNTALSCGAKTDNNMEVKDQFYGDRAGALIDPFGQKWMVMTHIEDVSKEEMQKRYEAMFAKQKA